MRRSARLASKHGGDASRENTPISQQTTPRRRRKDDRALTVEENKQLLLEIIADDQDKFADNDNPKTEENTDLNSKDENNTQEQLIITTIHEDSENGNHEIQQITEPELAPEVISDTSNINMQLETNDENTENVDKESPQVSISNLDISNASDSNKQLGAVGEEHLDEENKETSSKDRVSVCGSDDDDVRIKRRSTNRILQSEDEIQDDEEIIIKRKKKGVKTKDELLFSEDESESKSEESVSDIIDFDKLSEMEEDEEDDFQSEFIDLEAEEGEESSHDEEESDIYKDSDSEHTIDGGESTDGNGDDDDDNQMPFVESNNSACVNTQLPDESIACSNIKNDRKDLSSNEENAPSSYRFSNSTNCKSSDKDISGDYCEQVANNASLSSENLIESNIPSLKDNNQSCFKRKQEENSSEFPGEVHSDVCMLFDANQLEVTQAELQQPDSSSLEVAIKTNEKYQEVEEPIEQLQIIKPLETIQTDVRDPDTQSTNAQAAKKKKPQKVDESMEQLQVEQLLETTRTDEQDPDTQSTDAQVVKKKKKNKHKKLDESIEQLHIEEQLLEAIQPDKNDPNTHSTESAVTKKRKYQEVEGPVEQLQTEKQSKTTQTECQNSEVQEVKKKKTRKFQQTEESLKDEHNFEQSDKIQKKKKKKAPNSIDQDLLKECVISSNKMQLNNDNSNHNEAEEEPAHEALSEVPTPISPKLFFRKPLLFANGFAERTASFYTFATNLKSRADDLPKSFPTEHDETRWMMISHASRQFEKDFAKFGYLLRKDIDIKPLNTIVSKKVREMLHEIATKNGLENDLSIDENEEMNSDPEINEDEGEDGEEEGDLFNMRDEDLVDIDEKLRELDSDDEAINDKPEFTNNRTFKKTVVDDAFFSLRKMEADLDEVERREANDNSIFDLDDGGETSGDIRYEDFFGKRSEIQLSDAEPTSKKRKAIEQNGVKNKKERLASSSNSLKKDQVDSEHDDDDEHPVLLGNINEKEAISALQARIKKLNSKVEELHAENLAPRSWELQGEVKAGDRDEDALLQRHIQFDAVNKKPPEVTEQFTSKLEGIIIQRIKDRTWDDPVRKVKDIKADEPKRFARIEDRQIEKRSLTDEMVDKYQKDTGLVRINENETNPAHAEIQKLYGEMNTLLDALFHYEFTPPPVKPEIKIVSNMAAFNVEEVGPVASTDEQLLAPEEMKKHAKGDIKADEERSKTDKLRARRQKKLRQRILGEKETNKNHTNGEDAEKTSMFKKKKKRAVGDVDLTIKPKHAKIRPRDLVQQLAEQAQTDIKKLKKKSTDAPKQKFGVSRKFVL